jgi:hypothetical protein
MRMLKLAAVISLSVIAATPAYAVDNYLFGFSPFGVQTLTINGTTVIQARDTGWIRSDGQHQASNQNYIVGECSSCGGAFFFNDYFTFDLSNVSDPIVSAVLSAGNGNGYAAGALSTYSLFDVNAPVSSLDVERAIGDPTGLALFSDLQSGILFGSRSITSVTQNSQVDTTLNGSALTALNGARGSIWAIGGTLRPGTEIPGGGAVPEPSTWAMMLLGFGAMGLALRRRRRAAIRQFA